MVKAKRPPIKASNYKPFFVQYTGIVVFAIIGVLTVYFVRAAVMVTTAEPEAGTLLAPATQVSDAAASGSMAIKFGAGSTGGGTVPGVGPVDMTKVFTASDTMTCPVGTDGGVQDGYRQGVLVKIRICNVAAGTGTVKVNARIAANVDALYKPAKAAGITMGGGGFRTMDQQIAARQANNCPDIMNSPSSACSPPTAKPGYSNHQMGLAIDFTQGGGTLSSSSTGFTWLKANAASYYLKNLPSEAWHWSVDGS